MRLLVSAVVALATSAIALLVAAIVLDDFKISTLTFPVVVVIFGAILLVSRAAVHTLVHEHVPILRSVVGLIGAFVALVITDVVSDGLDIKGVRTWVVGTLIVWIGMFVADLVVGRRLFERLSGDRKRQRRA